MHISKKVKEKLDFAFKLYDLFDEKEKRSFFFVIAAALFMAVFQAIGVASILPFINMVMNPEIILGENNVINYFFHFLNFESTNSFIIFSGFVVFGLVMASNFISAFSTWIRIRFVWQKNHRLSTELLEKYLSRHYTYFLNNNTADLGKNVLAEVQQLTGGFLLSLITIITSGLVALMILVLLLYVNVLMTLGTAVFLISFYLAIYFYFSDKLKLEGERRFLENKGRYKAVTESLGGIKDIKVLGVEKFFLRKFSKHSENFSDLQSWYQVVSQAPRYVMEMVAFGGIVMLLIFLVWTNTSTQKVIPLISFFAFAGYRLIPALQEVFNSFATVGFNKSVLDRIYEDVKEKNPENILLEKGERKSISFNDEIRLKNICFSYPKSDRTILSNINLEIKKNSFVALIGATGSGKTTLVDLILGLLSPDKGVFAVDSVEINEKNIRNWQSDIGYVPQQIYLSDDTVTRNIAFGLPDEKIDMEQVEKVARMANIHEFIKKDMVQGYNTLIGERGIRLSGGQRQRIGIARALYYDPQVLLLDEATSSLDNRTEKEVLDAIDNVAKSKTIIAIAHRLTTVKNCDKVYLIDKGEIVDQGSYEELVNKKLNHSEENK